MTFVKPTAERVREVSLVTLDPRLDIERVDVSGPIPEVTLRPINPEVAKTRVHYAEPQDGRVVVLCGTPLTQARAEAGTTQNREIVTCAHCRVRLAHRRVS